MIELNITPAHLGLRPQVPMPDPDFYRFMKEEGIRQLVNDHYNLLVKTRIKHMFPVDPELLDQAKNRAADFFVQICGGHPYYMENRGRPMMVKRHEGFRITQEARLIWLNCYKDLLLQLDIPDKALKSFWEYLNIFSMWMINSR